MKNEVEAEEIRSEMKMNTITHGDMKKISIKQIVWGKSKSFNGWKELSVRKLRVLCEAFSFCGGIPGWKMNECRTMSTSAIQLHIFYGDAQQTKLQKISKKKFPLSHSRHHNVLLFPLLQFSVPTFAVSVRKQIANAFFEFLLCFDWDTKPEFYGSLHRQKKTLALVPFLSKYLRFANNIIESQNPNRNAKKKGSKVSFEIESKNLLGWCYFMNPTVKVIWIIHALFSQNPFLISLRLNHLTMSPKRNWEKGEMENRKFLAFRLMEGFDLGDDNFCESRK